MRVTIGEQNSVCVGFVCACGCTHVCVKVCACVRGCLARAQTKNNQKFMSREKNGTKRELRV